MKGNKHLKIIVLVIVSLVLLCIWYYNSKIFLSETEERLETAIKAFNQKKFAETYSIVEPLAKKGEPAAQLILGNLYYLGLGVSQNCE